MQWCGWWKGNIWIRSLGSRNSMEVNLFRNMYRFRVNWFRNMRGLEVNLFINMWDGGR